MRATIPELSCLRLADTGECAGEVLEVAQ